MNHLIMEAVCESFYYCTKHYRFKTTQILSNDSKLTKIGTELIGHF